MLIEAVEKRFGDIDGIPETHTLEFLSDNGGAYIAAETRQIARQLGLKPVNTPVCSPQSNGMPARALCVLPAHASPRRGAAHPARQRHLPQVTDPAGQNGRPAA